MIGPTGRPPILAMAALLALLVGCNGQSTETAPPPAVPATGDLPWQAATLTVGAAPQQTFAGFGFSLEQGNAYATLSAADRAEVDRLLFEPLNTRILRLWYGPGEPETIRDYYLASGVISSALDHGVTELLLAPWLYGLDPDVVGDPDEHAQRMANDIATLRNDYGIPITATGVINEPDAEEWKRLPVAHYVPLAIAMRREMTARGLDDVTLLGPEFASADDAPRRWFDAIAVEPEALAAVDAIATHSYNMAADPDLAERALVYGKQYWMTEAGGGSFDGSAEFDRAFAASASARFLNDLNNGVTHWVWFIGLGEGSVDVFQKLVMCEGSCANPVRIYKNAAYHHVQQVSQAFPPGTVMRHTISDLPDWPDMVWTYGPKPPLHAAAGIRPDGRWVLAVVNDTPGINALPHTGWDDPTNYQITFNVPELADIPTKTFNLCRTNTVVLVECEETVDLIDGQVTLPVTSLEVITLVARDPGA